MWRYRPQTTRLATRAVKNAHSPPEVTVPDDVDAIVCVTYVTCVTVGAFGSTVVVAAVFAGASSTAVNPAPRQ
jgi:hypothetical protein